MPKSRDFEFHMEEFHDVLQIEQKYASLLGLGFPSKI